MSSSSLHTSGRGGERHYSNTGSTNCSSSSSCGRHSGGGSGRNQNGPGRGRGEHYKNKYGRNRITNDNNNHLYPNEESDTHHRSETTENNYSNNITSTTSGGGGTYSELHQLLQSIDGRQYPQYHSIETHIGAIRDLNNTTHVGRGWVYPIPNTNDKNTTTRPFFTLYIGRTQSDPYAPPTKCRIVIPIMSADPTTTNTTNGSRCSSHVQLPPDLIQTRVRRMATCDYLWRQIYAHCQNTGAHRTIGDSGGRSSNDNTQVSGSTTSRGGGAGGWSGPKGGDIQIIEPTQHVMEQSAVQMDETNTNIICHLTINLPARGRSILGNVAYRIFDSVLSGLVRTCFSTTNIDMEDLRHHVDCIDDQAFIQDQLDSLGLVAFICNGAILPRRSGIDDRPMLQNNKSSSDRIEPFVSPKSMEVSLALPNSRKTISGMGIPKGITLVCGGGYHGKSTLLEAIQYGVYYKIPNDGREYCMTSIHAMKIRAEDGRCINQVDISSFIKNIPSGKDTTSFCSPDASGSTSQASNIVEAIELGANVLLMDEDTCATNFMIRDSKMMQLVACEKEPITPYVRVIQSLKEQQDISTILVVGGTGDYFDVADHVLVMDSYRCVDATVRAKEIVTRHDAATSDTTAPAIFVPPRRRYPILPNMRCQGKIKVLARNIISYGDIEIDLSMTEQIISKYQANAIASIIQYLSTSATTNHQQRDLTLNAVLDEMDAMFQTMGADAFHAIGSMNGAFLRPRKLDIGAAINRLRISNCIQQQQQQNH